MPTYTTTNDKVQYYLTYSSKRASKHRKIQRMNSISKSLETVGVYLDELFQRKSIRVLDEIAYLTTICGVIKIGAEKLAELAQTSVRTVYSAVKTIKQHKELGFLVGYLKSTHKYVFVDLKASNAPELLKDIFGLTDAQIAECFADPKTSTKPVISRHTDEISDANNITKNKNIKDIKTSTKKSEASSPTYRSFYLKLKELFKARRGSLNGFKQFTGIIYSKMKKIRSENDLKLSHNQLELIMYQSFDILLNKKGVKNEAAMLNAIITNKINDMTIPQASFSPMSNIKRTEPIPDWFMNRNEVVETTFTLEEKAEFEAQRAQILKDLGIQ